MDRTSLSVCSVSRSALMRVRVSVRETAILLVGAGVIGSSIFVAVAGRVWVISLRRACPLACIQEGRDDASIARGHPAYLPAKAALSCGLPVVSPPFSAGWMSQSRISHTGIGWPDFLTVSLLITAVPCPSLTIYPIAPDHVPPPVTPLPDHKDRVPLLLHRTKRTPSCRSLPHPFPPIPRHVDVHSRKDEVYPHQGWQRFR